MSQSLKTTVAIHCVNSADVSTAQSFIATIERRLSGVETYDREQVAEDLARQIEPIARRDRKDADAERALLRAKTPAADAVASALHALRKLLASGVA